MSSWPPDALGDNDPQLSQWKSLPPLYILPTHLSSDALHEIEDKVRSIGAPLTYDATEAGVFIGKVERKSRALFELRARKVWTEESIFKAEEPVVKKRRTDVSLPLPGEVIALFNAETESKKSSLGETTNVEKITMANQQSLTMPGPETRLLVVQLIWLDESLRLQRLLPIEPFIIYNAIRTSKPDRDGVDLPSPSTPGAEQAGAALSDSTHTPSLQRANESTNIPALAGYEAQARAEKGHPTASQHRRRFKQRSVLSSSSTQNANLKRMTTSEFEEANAGVLPEPPEWVKNRTMYSCLRSTSASPPNAQFISELLKIKGSRVLTLDEVGVRAYSTSIASLAAYPYPIRSPVEIMRLPGCHERLASHFSDFQATSDEECERYVPAARDLDKDENLQILKIFFAIWGCGADTARRMYFNHGWRSMDDVVEYGWSTLSRVQQIGVKYYDEFKVSISRKEAEEITEIIKQHARNVRSITDSQWNTDEDIVAIMVGGYRRGKDECADVDIILSHRAKEMTENLVVDVLSSLEKSGYVTHTLTLNTTTTQRGQRTLPYASGHASHGFDSLDKALCVWQEPDFSLSSPPPSRPQQSIFETNSEVEKSDTTDKTHIPTKKKNPNFHRRVDIIVSPWCTIGAAVLGWSGATTFERDIRRWCKNEKGWKFDSSGVRDRRNGHVLDLEAPRLSDDKDTWLDREKRLMEGLGIGWRPPTERCTG